MLDNCLSLSLSPFYFLSKSKQDFFVLYCCPVAHTNTKERQREWKDEKKVIDAEWNEIWCPLNSFSFSHHKKQKEGARERLWIIKSRSKMLPVRPFDVLCVDFADITLRWDGKGLPACCRRRASQFDFLTHALVDISNGLLRTLLCLERFS